MTGTDFADLAPSVGHLTAYDRARLGEYLRLLDADASGANWEEVARVVLGVDPRIDPKRCERMYRSHLERARWVSGQGFADLAWQSTDGASRRT